jgi:hypothetical protein
MLQWSGEEVHGPFADAVESVIGDHLHEQPVFPGIAGDVSFDGDDFHNSQPL